jgi:basic amino acid/polyamine antiporter, APA family
MEDKRLKLKPTLGLLDATAISVGAIIGAGIFVVTGIVAGMAGPALLISMVIAATVSLLTALSFAELSAWLPREGSVYEFSYRLISPFAGFTAGWMWMLGNIFGGAAVSLGFAYYFTSLFPVLQPKLIAALLCLAFTVLNLIGIKRSAVLNNLLVGSKLIILTFFIILGLGYVKVGNFRPFIPSYEGILFGACYIFFAYGGFARVSVVAEEVKDAEHTVPRAILLSLLISTIFYLLIGAVAIGLVGAAGLSSSTSPLSKAISVTGSSTAVYLVTVGGLMATASVLLTSILGVSREAYAMARRNALPSALSKLHPKYDTPYYAIWISGLVMSILALTMDLTKVVALSTFGQLVYYALANISDLKLRSQKGVRKKMVQMLGAVSCLGLLVFLFFVSPESWIAGLAGLIFGCAYYLIRRRKKPESTVDHAHESLV